MSLKAYNAAVFHLLGDPADMGADVSRGYYEDGLLIVEDGVVKKLGARAELEPGLPADVQIASFANALIIPGFVDSHIHFPQMDVIASPGDQLMDWLNEYTFPAEAAFEDPAHGQASARFFLDELLRNGTTSALVFGSVHKASVDALFGEALARNMRIIAGKVLMDRNAPAHLCDTPETGYGDSKALIQKWHGKGRLRYAVTPRFAFTCSEKQLRLAGDLLNEFDDILLHTHLSENEREISLVKELFPQFRDYLDVYDGCGLLANRSVFAHGVHLSADEMKRLSQAKAGVAFCPTSNLFLGSGLFDFARVKKHGIKIGLGTDIGGGTSFSLFQTMNEAYKVCQLQGDYLDAFTSFYLATLGGAELLGLADKIGNFEPGKEADFIVLDLEASPLLARRLKSCRTIEERLFVLSILGDDRAVRRAYLAGDLAYARA